MADEQDIRTDPLNFSQPVLGVFRYKPEERIHRNGMNEKESRPIDHDRSAQREGPKELKVHLTANLLRVLASDCRKSLERKRAFRRDGEFDCVIMVSAHGRTCMSHDPLDGFMQIGAIVYEITKAP
jgi:hypothetical protein